MKASAKISGLKAAASLGNSAFSIVNSDNSWEVKLNAGIEKEYTVTDSHIKKSDGVLIKSLPATQDYEVPDSIGVDGDGSQIVVKATDSFFCKTLLPLIEAASAAIIYADLNTALKIGGVVQLLSTSNLIDNLTGPQINGFIQALSTSVIYADLTALEKQTLVDLYSNAELSADLTSGQVAGIIQALTANTIYADLLNSQKAGLVPLFSAAEINANITTGQVTGLGAANVQKLIQSQINNLVNAQLLMLSNAQLIYVLTNAMSQQFINDNLSQATRNKLNAIYTLQTGQTTSFAAGDDPYFGKGRLINFSTLPLNNSFGNTNRYTDDAGMQVYTYAYAIDHATGIGWCLTLQPNATWAVAVAKYSTFTLTVNGTTYNDFRLPNNNELLSACNWSKSQLFSNAPFTAPGIVNLWSSTTLAFNSANAHSILTQAGALTSRSKTNSDNYYMCRTHF